ncbi:hypothetical protein BOX15_Mlig004543g1, partial [Macrostomum lignano]
VAQRYLLLAGAGLACLAAGPLLERLLKFLINRRQSRGRCRRQFDCIFFSGGSLLPPCQAASQALAAAASSSNDPAVFCPDPSDCRLSHSSQHPYFQLIRQLASAVRSLDLCMYTLSSPDLSALLLALSQRKPRPVRVRVICDSEQLHSLGSAIAKLRSAGLPIRADSTSYFMHHKFCVIDRSLVLTGSLNWTGQGTLGNWENVVALDDVKVVEAFRREFERLWQEFSPASRSAR